MKFQVKYTLTTTLTEDTDSWTEDGILGCPKEILSQSLIKLRRYVEYDPLYFIDQLYGNEPFDLKVELVERMKP